MDASIVQRLVDRVDRLDRENRRLKRIGFAAILSGVALITFGGARLEENEIVLRDPNNNNIRITLGTNPQTGSAGIQIFDRQGRRRIVLATGANNDIPAFFYYDANGNEKRQDRD